MSWFLKGQLHKVDNFVNLRQNQVGGKRVKRFEDRGNMNLNGEFLQEKHIKFDKTQA